MQKSIIGGRLLIQTMKGGLNMTRDIRLPDCQSFSFSHQLSQERVDQAVRLFGADVIQRILCFALYLLGVNRSAIGHAMDMPSETVKSIIKALKRDGLSAFEDRRRRRSSFLPETIPQGPPITLQADQEHLVVDLGFRDRHLRLLQKDTLQMKILLLTMLNNGWISTRQVAQAMDLTPAYIGTLAQRLARDGALSLLDQRGGQKQDYRVPPEVKAEIIQQFASDIIIGGQTSGEVISAALKDRCHISVPARTIRHHMANMGLSKIKRSLPELVATVKKTSKDSSES